MGILQDLIKRRNANLATPPTDAQRIAAKGGNFLRLGEKMARLGSPDIIFPEPPRANFSISGVDYLPAASPDPMPAAQASPMSPMQIMSNRIMPPARTLPRPAAAPVAAPVDRKAQEVENIRGVLGMPSYEAGDRIAGNLLVDSATGKPKGLVKAAAMGVNDANTMVDAAIAKSRFSRPLGQNYGQGLGSGIAPANVAAEQAFRKGLEDQRNANRQQMASQRAAFEQRGEDPANRILRRVIKADRNPEQAALETAYSQKLQDQRQQSDDAQGLRARMAVGKPLNQDEAQMFSNQQAMQQEALLSRALGQTNPSAALQAMQNKQQLQAKTAQSLQELALRDTVAKAQVAAAQKQQEIEMKRLQNEEAKQNFLQSPEGVRNGMLLGGATAKEIQDAGLPIPQTSTNPLATAPTTAAVVAGTQANQQLRTLPVDAQLASLEGLLNASGSKNFNVNDAISAGVDERQLMALANAQSPTPYDPTVSAADFSYKAPSWLGPIASLENSLKEIQPLNTSIGKGVLSAYNDFVRSTGMGQGYMDIEEWRRRMELQLKAKQLSDMMRNARSN